MIKDHISANSRLSYQALIREVDSLIKNEGEYNDDGYSLRYEALDEVDQQKIVALFINDDDRDLFSVYENERYSDIVDSLLNMLRKETQEDDQDFTACIKEKLRNYYAKRAQVLINERCSELESYELAAEGRHRRIDRNHGDSVVSRIGG